jgi:hypothetical protein
MSLKKQQVKKHPIYDVFFYSGIILSAIGLILILIWIVPHIDFKNIMGITEYANADNFTPIMSCIILAGINLGLAEHLKEQPDESAYSIFKNYVIGVFLIGMFVTFVLAAYRW